jgi:adenosylmethionine-8-amino-7-oxononanoate aminotransferase
MEAKEPPLSALASASASAASSSMNQEELDELVRLDQEHVWHPYAAMPNSTPCVPIESANGVTLHLSDGRTMVDGMSSWWAAVHGYNHPTLNDAITNQVGKMSHVMFGGLTHEPAIRLAQKLVEVSKMDHVFYCDSGSVAIEVGMKMAIQYWYNVDLPKKSRFLTIKGGYHGDTFKAMSVCDPVNGMHHMFSSVLANQLFCDRPSTEFHAEWDESDMDNVKQCLKENSDEICAIILEPIVQGAGGMRMYHPTYLRRIRELCDEYSVLLICDEIATGFGRTGKMMASEHAGIVPDILCVGKALSGGYLSFAATLTCKKVSETFAKGPSGVLMHGPTFMGNPLACAVSLASLELLETNDWQSQVSSIQEQLEEELEPCRESPLVQDVRVLGAIGVVEMKESMDMKEVQPWLVDQGVWLRPFGKLLYTMPPFVIRQQELCKITSTMLALTRRFVK